MEESESAFNDIALEKSNGSSADVEDDVVGGVKKGKKLQKKRKKIYFTSDFVDDKQETTSSEESESESEAKENEPLVNPSDLTWMMWFWYYIVFASTKTFNGAEFCGEKLADFFGITAPKYQYAINEYYRLKEEEEEEAKVLEREQAAIEKREAEKMAALEGGVDADVKVLPNAKIEPQV